MSDLTGRTIARRYLVESFLGKGGMAEVHKVWDQERSVHLAMKILHADLAEDKVFLRRFTREARTLAKLQHPNIVRFYGMEQGDDLVYILMDYVEGITLRKEIFQSKEPLPLERIQLIIKSVCAALYYAHKLGFVHCDVKPANIMIHSNGTVYVSDFGIARMTEASTVTMAGAGTPAYMAPEQVRGEVPLPQTDIYSLGVVLFEMLTGGERPFTGEKARTTGTTSEKVRWEQLRLMAPPPSKYNPSILPHINKIVLKCLDKSPANRYLSTMDLYNDLMTQGIAPVPPLPIALPSSGGVTSGESVSGGAVMSDDGSIINASTSPPISISGEVKKQAQEMESQAIRFEMEGNLWDALHLFYEIKRIDLSYPHVDIKINKLEKEIQSKSQAKPTSAYRTLIEKIFSIKKSKSVLLKSFKPVPRFAWIAAIIFFVSLFFVVFQIPSATVEGNNGVYFSSDRAGEMQIYHINNTGRIRQVTTKSNNFEAVRGNQGIYFTSDRSGKYEIFHLGDDSVIRQITHTNKNAESWGPIPYGFGIYFVSNRSGKPEIYYFDKAGVKQVTNTPGNYMSTYPAPISSGLYFSSDRSGKFEVFFMNHQGEIVQITHTKTPLGSRLTAPSNNGFYYVSDRDGENFEIFYMDSKGFVTQITNTRSNVTNLNPLTESNGLYFVSDRTDTFEVYHLGKNGGLLQVTHSPEGFFSLIGSTP